ncbi:biotin transporter BioY [Kumtagia ephedrae]|uniref:Biotin transporter n=1 Tax=Kumtagia ephedrae TaxID=2116701 RepID=A0A2P7RK32_9HYPH|nr:biotin transporter BioY [Mesorhizobium ephedrae]PSJ50515.1 biotin transporter BioY [Mesorhizobium ephedrae]
MNNSSAAAQPYVPLRLAGRPLTLKLVAVALGTLFLAASSWIEVPMFPVPMTMQTFAVTLIGALYGWRLGLATVLAWLGEAALGFPVLAGGAGGLAHFVGPTGGYLVAFPLAAMLVGWLAERGWTGAGRILSSVAAMLLGNAFILAFGGLWLAVVIGLADAIAFGVLPFILGGALKAVLATVTVEVYRRSGAKPAL